jgi:hypothetical protein
MSHPNTTADEQGRLASAKPPGVFDTVVLWGDVADVRSVIVALVSAIARLICANMFVPHLVNRVDTQVLASVWESAPEY